jgi:hypothetical protein
LMHQMHISTNQVSSVVLRPKNLEIQKQFWKLYLEPKKSKYCTMKLSQINPSKDIELYAWGR